MPSTRVPQDKKRRLAIGRCLKFKFWKKIGSLFQNSRRHSYQCTVWPSLNSLALLWMPRISRDIKAFGIQRTIPTIVIQNWWRLSIVVVPFLHILHYILKSCANEMGSNYFGYMKNVSFNYLQNCWRIFQDFLEYPEISELKFEEME